jgi:hypothetical protein
LYNYKNGASLLFVSSYMELSICSLFSFQYSPYSLVASGCPPFNGLATYIIGQLD